MTIIVDGEGIEVKARVVADDLVAKLTVKARLDRCVFLRRFADLVGLGVDAEVAQAVKLNIEYR